MRTMRAAVLRGVRDLFIEERPVPQANAGKSSSMLPPLVSVAWTCTTTSTGE